MDGLFSRMTNMFSSSDYVEADPNIVGVLLKKDVLTDDNFLKWMGEKYRDVGLLTIHNTCLLKQIRRKLNDNIGSLGYYSVYEDKYFCSSGRILLTLKFRDEDGKKILSSNFLLNK